MALVQSAGTTGATVPSFGSATTAGNLLVAVSVSAGATTFNQPAGFTSRSVFSATAFAGEVWTKIADGTETSINGTVTSGNGNYVIAEFDDPVAGGFDDVAEDHTNIATAVTSQGTGTATASGSGLALAVFWGDGSSTLEDGEAYSDSFVEAVQSTTSSARGGIWIAAKSVSAGSVSCTRSCTDTGDEMAGAMIVFLASGGGGGSPYTLTANHGTYSITGQAVALKADRKLTAAQGSYTLTGQDVRLARGYTLAANQGSYALSGQDVTLTYTAVGGYTMAAEYGTYSLSGQSVSLRAARKITAAQGSYTLFGQAVGVVAGRKIAAGQGSYSLSGQSVNLKVARALAAAYGSYAITGQSVTLTYSGDVPSVWTEVSVTPGSWSAVSVTDGSWTPITSTTTTWTIQ